MIQIQTLDSFDSSNQIESTPLPMKSDNIKFHTIKLRDMNSSYANGITNVLYEPKSYAQAVKIDGWSKVVEEEIDALK